MEYNLTPGENSNYEISLSVSEEEMQEFKNSVLQEFQKNMEISGFRKGNVPLDIVEQNVKPDYLKMGIYEEAINNGLKKIMDENPEKQFIGNIYDLSQDEKEGKTVLTFKLDVYPEAEVKDESWKDVQMEEVDTEVGEEEVDQTIENIKKQHAEYQDLEEMKDDSVVKVKISFQDQDGNEIDTGTAFLGKEDLEEFSSLKGQIVGKKLNEKVVLDYDENDLPAHLLYKKEGDKPSQIELELTEIKEEHLPEFTEDKVQEFFKGEVQSLQELRDKIAETVQQQKLQQGLVKNVEDYINAVEKHIEANIPSTIVNEEFKSRMENLKQRFGGEEAFNQYMEQMDEEQKNKMNEDVMNAARESLKKFFILRKVAEQLGIFDNINWQNQLEPEQKLYEKLTGKQISQQPEQQGSNEESEAENHDSSEEEENEKG